MSAAGPPQGANSTPSGGSEAAKPRAWGRPTALERLWYAAPPSRAAKLLAPLSSVFGAVSALRRRAYRAGLLRRVRIGVPVVVVGNVTVGGAGKTPLVAALVRELVARGRCPGIVSRGYGRRTGDVREVATSADPRDVGDEPLLLARLGVPVFVGAKRAAAAQALIAAHPRVDVIVSDDGLQHYALARDVEIAVVDAHRRFGNGLLLPAGPLREAASRLASVDAVVARNGTLPDATARQFAMTYEAGEWTNLADVSRRLDRDAFVDPAAVAIAGIGDPEPFFASLRAEGFRGRTVGFGDHHRFTRDDVAFRGANVVLMTEKDAVKCRAFRDARMWMRPIRARVDAALVDLVLEKIDGPEAPRNARLPRDEGSAHP